MSSNVIAYWDDAREVVVIARENGQTLAVFNSLEAKSFGQEVLSAADKQDTGYSDFLEQ